MGRDRPSRGRGSGDLRRGNGPQQCSPGDCGCRGLGLTVPRRVPSPLPGQCSRTAQLRNCPPAPLGFRPVCGGRLPPVPPPETAIVEAAGEAQGGGRRAATPRLLAEVGAAAEGAGVESGQRPKTASPRSGLSCGLGKGLALGPQFQTSAHQRAGGHHGDAGAGGGGMRGCQPAHEAGRALHPGQGLSAGGVEAWPLAPRSPSLGGGECSSGGELEL